MLLTKSCHSPNNIKKCNTIKIGTLHDYRTTEIEQIADRGEGTFVFNLKFEEEFDIPIKYFNMMQGGAIHIFDEENDESPAFPGLTMCHWHKLEYKFKRKGYVTLFNSSVTIQRQTLNSFVFCMSLARKTYDYQDVFPDYDDAWHIPVGQAENWIRGTGDLLLKAINKEHEKGNFVTPEHIPPKELVIHATHKTVQYIPREIHFTKSDLDFEKVITLMSSMNFIKPPTPFSKEKEYRFEYLITHNHKIIEPSVKHLILDVPKLPYIL